MLLLFLFSLTVTHSLRIMKPRDTVIFGIIYVIIPNCGSYTLCLVSTWTFGIFLAKAQVGLHSCFHCSHLQNLDVDKDSDESCSFS